MNALLIYPEVPTTFWGFHHALKFIHKRAYTPPLGLLTVGALLGEPWRARLVDMNVERLTKRDLAWADCVFLSAMHIQRASASDVIARCVEAGKPIVAGGPLFVHEHQHFPEVDHFVLNEAEVLLPELLADMAAGRTRRVYSTDAFADMRQSPAPRFELAKVGRYASMGLQYSRGCPFACEFCDVTALFGRRPRLKDAAQVIDELDRLVRLGWRERVFFVDDNIACHPRRLREELLPALIDWQQRSGPIPFATQASINLADRPELMDLMVRAGFDVVFVGVETVSDEALAACGKVQNTHRDLAEAIDRIQSAGMQVHGGFILGFDDESPSIFQRQVDFIESAGIVSAMVGLLQAFPGTRLYKRLRREGRLLVETDGDNVSDTTNFVPTMDRRTLQEGWAYVIRSLYTPKAYYRRARLFLRKYGSTRKRAAIQWQHIRAFLVSLVRLGVFGPERLQYWRLLGWTLLRRRKLFPVAVTLAIMGAHYRRIFDPAFSAETPRRR